jgi:hypothetical protein
MFLDARIPQISVQEKVGILLGIEYVVKVKCYGINERDNVSFDLL